MSKLKKAAIRLDKDEASVNESGWVILDGSPERDDTSLGTWWPQEPKLKERRSGF